MQTIYLAGALAATILLAACGEKASNADGTDATKASTDVVGAGVAVDDPSTAKAVKSSGTVTAIDKAARKITLDHQPIPEIGWPAMTMGFSVKPEVLGTIKVGDKVAFDAKISGNLGEITALSKE
ncbi:MAG: copper-binding protein [Novosphingobium sp.]|nr:copper-binding protein [Novosphingobium sp.]